jgi:hypothetical protein
MQEVSLRNVPKDKVRLMLIYGDVGRIAMRVPYDYHYVARVIRGDANNELIWEATIKYLEEQDDRSIDRRLVRAIKILSEKAA